MAVSESIKRVFVTKIRSDLTEIIKKIRRVETAVKIFIQKDFQAGGDDAITDAHLAALGITQAELVLGKDLVDNLVNLVEGDDVVTFNYGETFNILRNDFGIEEPR